jgi:hypothetical protein
MDAHLPPGGRLKLDDVFGTDGRRRRDQFDESRLARPFRSPLAGRYEKPFQFAGVQMQMLSSPIDSVLPGSIDRELP